jgi:hypothetical protein
VTDQFAVEFWYIKDMKMKPTFVTIVPTTSGMLKTRSTKARKTAKFTDNQASFIIFEQIMKQKPLKENINNWIE